VFASKARCGPIPLRLAYWALRGISPALAEEALGEDWAFARCARGFGVRFQGLLRTDPAPLGVWGLRGIGPALAEEGSGEEGLSRCARGVLVFASKACCGPIPLRLAYGALRGIGPALAEEALGRMGLSRCARGILVFASKACSGPIPLRWACWGLRGIGPARAEEGSGEDGAFALCARGFGVRFQGLLRTDPAPLAYVGGSAGTVLRSLRKLWEGLGFRAARWGFWCSLPRLAPDRSRSAGVCGGLRGNGPALAEEALGRIGLSRCALGILVIASKARCGPIPLRWAYWALRGIGPALAEEALGADGAFALCARGFGVRFQGLLRTDPAPLGVWGAPRDRSCAR
jgi:hypothetical protein